MMISLFLWRRWVDDDKIMIDEVMIDDVMIESKWKNHECANEK